MCLKVKAEVTQSDINRGSQQEAESCAIALTLKRDGFKNVVVDEDRIVGTKMGVVWAHIGTSHNLFIEKFDEDKKKVKPRKFNFSFEPLKIVEKEEKQQ